MTATRTASLMEPGQPVAWGSLERAAFEDFPDVVAALRGTGVSRASRRKLLFLIPLGLLIAIIYAAPVWGMATVVGPWGLSQTNRTAEGDITAAGIIFAIAFLSLLVHAVIWFATGRPAKTALRGSASMAFFLGGLSAGVAVKRGLEDSVPTWGLWVTPMLACMVLGAVMFVLVARVKSEEPREALSSSRNDFRSSEAYAGPVRECIERVSDIDKAMINSDLRTAVDDLERRGVVLPGAAREARSAPLGFLAAQMSKTSAGK